MWHRLQNHDIMTGNDRRRLDVLPMDKFAALPRVPKKALTAQGAECSLSEELMALIKQPKVPR
jgi:hypothetical protein